MHIFTYIDESHEKLAGYMLQSFCETNPDLDIEIIRIGKWQTHFDKVPVIIDMLNKHDEIFYVDADCLFFEPLNIVNENGSDLMLGIDYGVKYAPWIKTECERFNIDPDLYYNAGVIYANKNALPLFKAVHAMGMQKEWFNSLHKITCDQTMLNIALRFFIFGNVINFSKLVYTLNWQPLKTPFYAVFPTIIHFAGCGNVAFKENLFKDILDNKDEFRNGYKRHEFPWTLSQHIKVKK